MAINKAMRLALKALSYPDIDMKKMYKLHRQVISATSRHIIKPLYKTWDHDIYYNGHRIPVRLFSPKPSEQHNLLLFFHGGGWVTEDINSYDRVCRYMAKITDCTVVSVDYQLAPEHPFPAGLEDCYTVTREILTDHLLLQVEPQQVTLIGDSAGGNLAAAVSLMARDRGEFAVHQQILLYPATYNDHTAASPYRSVVENGTDYLLTSKRICDYMELYQSCDADRLSPYFAPLLAKDFSEQPRTLIITAEYDPLRDEGEAYGRKLREAGNDVTLYRMRDALHGFFMLEPRYVHVRRAYEVINRFLHNRPGDSTPLL